MLHSQIEWFAFQLAIILGNERFSPAVVNDDAEVCSAGDGILGEQVRALKIDGGRGVTSATRAANSNNGAKQLLYEGPLAFLD